MRYSIREPDGSIDFNKASLIALVTVSGILILGILVLPDIFWDGFLWKYFAGPIQADADDEITDGISPGYNPVNTLTYGIILAWSVSWIYRFLEKKKISVDLRFALSIIPYILLGSTLRVLEDADFFSSPVKYIMISPLIYIVIGLFTIFMVLMGNEFESYLNEGKKGEVKIYLIVSVTLTSIFAGYGILYYDYQQGFEDIEQLLLLGIIAFLSVNLLGQITKLRKAAVPRQYDTRIIGYDIYLGFAGWSLFITALVHLCWWGRYEGDDLHFRVIPGILCMTFLAWGLMLLLLRLLNSKWNLNISTSLHGLNSLMIFSQFLDGAATFAGLEFYGYREKHVLPSLLIDLTGTAAVMFLLKFLVLLFAIYLLDVEFRKELENHSKLWGLVKLVVIILGLAPGTRDMLRLAFGT